MYKVKKMEYFLFPHPHLAIFCIMTFHNIGITSGERIEKYERNQKNIYSIQPQQYFLMFAIAP